MKDNKFYNINISVPMGLSQEGAKLFLVNEIYKVSCLFYETIGEHGELLRGNGHHMAQELASKAEEIWDKHLAKPKRTEYQVEYDISVDRFKADWIDKQTKK